MKAVVMAGGEGSRLRPVTANLPKPLVPICNRPIMEHILGLLKRHGITDVVATVHYLADEIQGYFGDGSDFGLSMAYSIENTPLGTAGSVKKAEGMLTGGLGSEGREGSEGRVGEKGRAGTSHPPIPPSSHPFLIVSGDALTDCDLTKAIEFHKAKGSMATLILYRVPNPLEFGVVITDSEDRIQRFLEKPGWSEVFSDTVNTGMYILEPEVLDWMEPGKSYDWSRDIFPKLLEQGKPMFGYVMEGYWADVGSLIQYREAQEHMLAGRADLPLAGDQVQPGVYMGPGCEIDKGATLVPPMQLGANVKVRKGARVGPYTVIGDSCFVEEGARVERSVIWDSSYVGPNVSVTSAIVGARATIKKDSVVSEDAVIGDRCLIDVGCTIRPRVKIWPDKIIERGSTVTMSLVYGNKWRGNLFRELGVAGLSNIEITPDFAVRLGAAFGSVLPARSRVVTSRDSTRSSRMAKRAIVAALLSVGCDVLDLRGVAAPIARHFVKDSGAAGAINVRKLPGNARVSLIEMFDGKSGYLSQAMERKVENAFFREDFTRTDPDDLGVIDNVIHAIDDYQRDFFARLQLHPGKRMRIVLDYGYTALGPIFPAMLSRLGVESIGLNTFNDAKLAPRSPQEVAKHVENVRQIVNSLGYDMGALLTNEGERLTIVDDRGEVLEGNSLFAALCMLVARSKPGAGIAMQVTAPSRLERALTEAGARVVRTKAGVRGLLSAASLPLPPASSPLAGANHPEGGEGVSFAGDAEGGFVFPELHPGFDAAFSLARLITMLQSSGASLSSVAAEVPAIHMAYEQVRVPFESKGTAMRRIAEEAKGQVDLLDGVKTFEGDDWVLVLPDSVEPLFHVYAEAGSAKDAKKRAAETAKKVSGLL